MAPNWHATASNAPSPNGSASASACCQVTSAVSIRAAARSSIGRLRSVATIAAPAGRARARARVATPVPAAVSSTLAGARAASLAARSRA